MDLITATEDVGCTDRLDTADSNKGEVDANMSHSADGGDGVDCADP